MAHEDEKKPDESDESAFELEPAEADVPSPEPAKGQEKHVQPLDLEPAAEEPSAKPASAKVSENSERCPNCGAPMPDPDALVCLRCGYDLKRLEVTRTRVGKPEEIDEEQVAATTGPVSRPGRGDLWLPLAMAAVSGVLLIIGYFAGALALFPGVVAATPEGAEVVIPAGTRFLGLLQLLVLVALWVVCGMAGLFLLAQALQRPVGEMQLAATRMLGIVVTIRLATFISMPGPRWVEWLTESALQAAAFIGLSILLFALKPRDGAMMGGFTLIALVGLWLLGRAMVWALEGRV